MKNDFYKTNTFTKYSGKVTISHTNTHTHKTNTVTYNIQTKRQTNEPHNLFKLYL